MENFESIIENIDLDLGYWQHPRTGEDRWYVNNILELIGLELTCYNTGNISSAYYKGEKISNSRAKRMVGSIGKAWITTDGKIHTQYWGNDETAREAIEVIEAKISAALEAETAEEQAEETAEAQIESLDCPACGSDDIDTNTFEAWCFDCEWQITSESDPELFARYDQMRRAERAAIAQAMDNALATS